MNFLQLFTIVIFTYMPINSIANDEILFLWPNQTKAAISLSYDDALDSQLTNAIPTLDKYQLKATFYLVTDAQGIFQKTDQWRSAAKNGHELGNHTLYNSCSGSKPNREWVKSFNDLDNKTLEEQILEISTANTLLEAIDGQKHRTFTLPCFDNTIKNKNYIPYIGKMFAGIKSHIGPIPESMNIFNVKDAAVFAPNQHTGKELIAIAKQAAQKGTIANFTFHGVGGDYLSVSKNAHEELLKYLADHQDIYWVGTYRNISLYLTQNQ